LPTLGFRASDFRIFGVEGFSARMQQIYEHVRPRLVRLGDALAPELSRGLDMEFFPHVAKHMRRTVNPPAETWAAWGPSPKGYTRYGYLALCVSRTGLHARAVVKSEAEGRTEIACLLHVRAAELEKSFGRTAIARYDQRDTGAPARPMAADRALFDALADAVAKKTGGIDVGFGWPVADAIRLERAELLDAFRELEPLYRIFRSVA
jgi:uncharacterized protein YktB (UPF0637 family)